MRAALRIRQRHDPTPRVQQPLRNVPAGVAESAGDGVELGGHQRLVRRSSLLRADALLPVVRVAVLVHNGDDPDFFALY